MTNSYSYLHDPREAKRMAYAMLIVDYIERDPRATIEMAESNLDPWLNITPDAPHYIEWSNILGSSTAREVSLLLLKVSGRGRHLRNPFVGSVTEEERQAILGGSSDMTRAATQE